MRSYLDFEKPIAELESKVEELREVAARDELIRVGTRDAEQHRGLGDRVHEWQFDRFTHR